MSRRRTPLEDKIHSRAFRASHRVAREEERRALGVVLATFLRNLKRCLVEDSKGANGVQATTCRAQEERMSKLIWKSTSWKLLKAQPKLFHSIEQTRVLLAKGLGQNQAHQPRHAAAARAKVFRR
jgi:hypothetical protein